MTTKDILFSTTTLGEKLITNRFVSQPMEANDGEDGGKVSVQAIERYKKLAEGNWGIVVVEAASVTKKSLARRNGFIMNKENFLSFQQLAKAIKKANPNTTALIQITHSGRNSNSNFSEKVSIYEDDAADMRMLKTNEIHEIANAFIEAILLSEKAGFDGVDLKMCHGYFGSEMMRPANNRDDEWGGSFENRTRFLRTIVETIKQKLVNKHFIIGSRISMYEGIRGGCGTSDKDEIIEDLSERFKLFELMHKLGMDYVNISAGIPGVTSEITRPVKAAKLLYLDHLRYTKVAKEYLQSIESQMKVIGSGYSILKEEGLAITSELLEKDYADFVGWGRQNFADPLMPKKLKENNQVDWCIACSGCSKLMIAQENDGCIIFNDYYKLLWKTVNSKKG